jgi:hypothetical protein
VTRSFRKFTVFSVQGAGSTNDVSLMHQHGEFFFQSPVVRESGHLQTESWSTYAHEQCMDLRSSGMRRVRTSKCRTPCHSLGSRSRRVSGIRSRDGNGDRQLTCHMCMRTVRCRSHPLVYSESFTAAAFKTPCRLRGSSKRLETCSRFKQPLVRCVCTVYLQWGRIPADSGHLV